MKHLLLSLLLASSFASAVNLSEMKASDVCISAEYHLNQNVATPQGQSFPNSYRFPNLTTLISYGFVESREGMNCKYLVSGFATYFYTIKSANTVTIIYELTIYEDGKTVDDPNNAYTLTNIANVSNYKDDVVTTVDKLWAAFLRDWKQAHP